ncbi:MAG: hypothetical protein JEZ03_14370 [Bacteroidales bacterium]|nr:hypothetical protein [Bacteroidales bacterium]
MRITALSVLILVFGIQCTSNAQLQYELLSEIADEDLAFVNSPENKIENSKEEKGLIADMPREEGPVLISIDSNYSNLDSGDICAEAWKVGPFISPYWLKTPENPAQLNTGVSYSYLAGKLIQAKAVDASECLFNGLLANGWANPCGLEKARPQVVEWQNQFDETIFRAAKENRIPATLLKKLIVEETQFWPATNYEILEYGLGQATNIGLDPLFFYYPEFYKMTCDSVYSNDTCKKSYLTLSEGYRSLLRGYVIGNYINADCPYCDYGVDVQKAEESIDIFAKLLVANCHQVNQIMVYLTVRSAGDNSSYEDLWRFTLVNYNAGAGCLTEAMTQTLIDGELLTWDNVSKNLVEPCTNAKGYVENITR